MSRKLDLSRFRDDDSDDDNPFVPKTKLELTDLKSKVFALGNTKKSKKDLEREAEERRKKEDEEAAKLVMAEYEEAFEKPSGSTTRNRFVPAGGFVKAAATPVPVIPKGPKSMENIPRGPAAMGYGRPTRPSPPKQPSPPPGPKPRGKRAMDAFLEELKRNEAAREERLGRTAQPWENEKGGKPPEEGESTNLFITNLPQNITEESLGMFFAKHGPIGTVKIMWPRGEEDRRGTRGLMGFVNFMKRRDAELALEANDQLDWGGTIIRVTWSKSAPKPSKPIYDITTGRIKRSPSPRIRSTRNKRRDSTSSSRSRSPKPKRRRSPSDSKGRSRKRSRSDSRGRTRRRSYSSSSYSSYSDSRSRSRSRSPPSKSDLYRDQWVAKIDKDRAEFVKGVARKIRDRGSGYAEDLRMKEKGNKKYDFLSDNTLPEYHLYRSGLSSRYRFPTPPPDPFIDDGIASVYSTDSAEESEKERTAKGHLGKLARKRFEALLRVMSGKRAEIARAMEFALVRAEAADEVAEMVCESLKLGGTPVPRKMARLHLVSDILHNSASPLPNVWKYRLAFESRLSPVFAHLCTVTQSLDAYSGRISAEVFRNQVLAVLDIWDRWMLFNQGVNDTLRDLLLGKTSLSSLTSQDTISKSGSTMGSSEPKKSEGEMKGFKSGGFKSSFKPIGSVVSVSITDTAVQMGEVEDVDGEPMDGEDVDGEPMNEEDVDGEPMNEEDVDGEPMNEEDVDGEPLNEEDVDGEAMNGSNYLRRYDLKEEEDVDGEPMEILDEEDVDGIPF